jgi:hypothetical protein
MVKTAYRLFIATVVTTPKSVSHSLSNRYAVWKKLQGKNFSPLARNLLWQVSHGILPTRAFLKHRQVITEDKCAVCKSQAENLEHRFIDCPINHPTWATLHKILPFIKDFNLTQLMDLDFGLPPSSQRGAEILLSEGLYTLWTARNEVTFERRQHDGLSVRDHVIRRIKVRK